MKAERQEKFLLVDLGCAMGGVESYIQTLSGMLRERATVLCSCSPGAGSAPKGQWGESLFSSSRSLVETPSFLGRVGLLPMIVLRERVQIVVVNGLLEAVLLIPARLLGCEAVYTRHGPFEDDLYKWYGIPLAIFLG